MIISRFNKYVEKHGRVTYIVLGIIICFMFVIFVGHGNDSIGGCSGQGRNVKIAKIYGKNIRLQEFMLYKRMTDIKGYFRYGMFLSDYNDTFLNRETITNIRMVEKAKRGGFYKQVTDEEVAKAIQDLPFLKDKDGKFSVENFTNFKNGFLRNYGLSAKDFDELMRQDLAIGKMTDKVTADVKVDEAEIDKELAEYTLKYAKMDLDIENAVQVSEQEVKDYFEKRKADIPLDKLRTALVATVSIDEAKKLAAAANAPAELKVTDAEIAKAFEAGKDTLYKGQKLEQVKARILMQQQANKASRYARAKANAALAAVRKAAEGKELSTEEFTKIAQDNGAVVVATGEFSNGAEIPGLTGKHVQLANAIRTLDKKGDLTKNTMIDEGGFSFAMLTGIKDEALPAELNDNLTAKIKKLVIDDKAVAHYTTKVAPYAAAAAGTKSVWDLGRKSMEEIREDANKSDEQKQQAMMEISDFIREELSPFYQQEQRSASVAAFSYKDYVKDVVLTESDIQAGFDARKEEFDKISVRIAKILIKASAEDTDEQKNATKAKADEVYKKLTEGQDFTKLVAEYSDDEETKAKGGLTELTELDKLDPAIKKQVESMQVNQLSPVVGTADGHVIFKLMEKTAPKTLADVRTQLVKTLTDEAAKKAAMKDAELLAAAINADWDDKAHAADKRLDIFKSHITGTKAVASEMPLSKQYAYGAKGMAGESSAMKELFDATLDKPFTKAVEGKDTAYVACVNEIKPAYLQTPKENLNAAVNVYKRSVANEVTSKKATETAAAINAALKGGADLAKAAGELAFQDATMPYSKQNARQFADFHLRNGVGLVDVLDKTAVKTVAEPQKGYNDYVLVYVDAKNVPTGDEAKETRDNTREQLLAQKKNAELSKFLADVEKEADTQVFVPSLLDKDAK